jgi:hypothetical protein
MNFIISLAEVDFLVAMCKYGDLDMDMSLSRELWPVHSPLCLPRSLLLFYILKSEYFYQPSSHRAWIDFKQAGSFFLILRTHNSLTTWHCVRKRFENAMILAWSTTSQFNSPCDNVRVMPPGCIFFGMRVSNFQLNSTRGELDLTRFLHFWYQLSQSDALTAWHMLKLKIL